MRVLAGTSGYSYNGWKGYFYPEDLPQARMLGYYGEHFKAVEINNTFYRMPKESVLTGWAGQVPDDFSFVLKASRRITHQKRLKDAGGEISYLLRTASVLGDRLGPMLFQLPPHARKDLERLNEFLPLLPEGHRAAFEFRHESWFDDEVYDALRSRNAALVLSDAGKGGDASAPPPLVPTASYGYLRLRRPGYDAGAIRAWAERVAAQPWEEAYVFFKHEKEGAGPKLAKAFIEAFNDPSDNDNHNENKNNRMH